MPATERYQADWFAIIVLIATVLIIVFLVIAAIYFFNLMNLKPPSKGESTFLFWTSIVLAIIFLAIAIFALIRIFTHKAIVYEEETPAPVPIKAQTITTVPVQEPVAMVTKPTPIRISNIPKGAGVTTIPPSDISTTLSSVPLDRPAETSLNTELISIANAMNG